MAELAIESEKSRLQDLRAEVAERERNVKEDPISTLLKFIYIPALLAFGIAMKLGKTTWGYLPSVTLVSAESEPSPLVSAEHVPIAQRRNEKRLDSVMMRALLREHRCCACVGRRRLRCRTVDRRGATCGVKSSTL